jgi:ribose-phosphate pyrophosphokinase
MAVVTKMLESVGIEEIIVSTLHEEASAGMFSTPFKNTNGLTVLVDPIKSYLQSHNISSEIAKNVVTVTPDQEGVERARVFAKLLAPDETIEVAVTEKKRDLNTIHHSQAMELYGDVTGKTCIIIDDIITSGGTVMNSSDLCINRGAKNVLCGITHSDFNEDSPQKLQNSSIERFFTTNSIALKKDYVFPKLSVHSLASLLSAELKEYTES